MKQKTITIIFAAVTLLLGVKVSPVFAETYFITDSGSGNHSGTRLEDSMNVAEHNNRIFLPGDTIYIAGSIAGSQPLTPPSSGTDGNFITYRGDYVGQLGSLEQHIFGTYIDRMFWIKNKEYIRLLNLSFQSNAGIGSDSSNAAVWVEEYYGATGHIDIEGCSFTETVSGVVLQGDVRHVNVFRSTFRNMTNNGVATVNYWNRTDTTFPSFVTVGGSRENGNTFVNIGREDTVPPPAGSVPGQAIGTQADDLIFSYNHVYANEPGWGTGIYLNGVDRVLVEYNYFHDLDSVHRRPPITFKSDFDWINTDVVIRFNKIGPTHGGNTPYLTPDYGINVGQALENVVIYGNYIHDIDGIGMEAYWGWTLGGASDGKIIKNLYVFSNIINKTINQIGINLSGTDEGSDNMRNSFIVNNTLYRTVSNYNSEAETRYAINTPHVDSKYDGLTIKNNIIDTTRDNASMKIGIRAWTQSDLALDFNHHFSPGAVPMVHYDGSACAPCAWSSLNRPSGYGTHDTEGDPRYVNASVNNLSLAADSTCIDSGEYLDVSIPSFQIQNKNYTFDIGEGLDPSLTDWNQTIPVVATLKQREHGTGWEKGAYVYGVESPPNYSNADLNQDTFINVTDLGILMSDFGKPAVSALNPRSDINSDGTVSVADLGILMSEWK